MNFLGVHGGIGAMGIYFQQQGWKCLGNIETRKVHVYRDKITNKNTFEEFFDAPLLSSIPRDLPPVDLIFGQPKCGIFSNLANTGYGAKLKPKRGSLFELYGKNIWYFIESIQQIKPLFFYLDNLPKSLIVITKEKWKKALPDYNIQFEWVSNYHYGNPQKSRNRLFVIGSHFDSDDFKFIPYEVTRGHTVKERISDLLNREGEVINHDRHSRVTHDPSLTNLAKSTQWCDIAQFIREETTNGENLPYLAKDGMIKRRISVNKLHWTKHSHTLAGAQGGKFHPLTGYPISIRERCRLQGYPDNFIIQGVRLDERGEWTLRKNPMPVKQLNNTVPYEFTAEFGRQLCHYIETGSLLRSRTIRAIKPNKFINENEDLLS